MVCDGLNQKAPTAMNGLIQLLYLSQSKNIDYTEQNF